MKKLLQNLLRIFSIAILKKYHPIVIGVTGSVGKTSSKEAIFTVLSAKFSVRTNKKNFNNEFGLPLTIIGCDSPQRNILKWLVVFAKALWTIISPCSYPEVLVLEMGVDRPGDMDYLADLAKPKIGVITNIGVSHVEFFKSSDAILKEKSKILKYLDLDGYAIINNDDHRLRSLLLDLKSKVITYGLESGALLHLTEHKTIFSDSKNSYGTELTFSYNQQIAKVFVEGVIGLPHALACTAGIAAGLAMGMTLAEAAVAIRNYHNLPGRLRLVTGIHNSAIIDDTYNSAPASARAALEQLKFFPAAFKIAVLGDMLELGELSEAEHKQIAHDVLHSGANVFVAVGPQMRFAAQELRTLNFEHQNIFVFEKSTDAADTVKNLIRHNSVVLIKGSQGMRMEKIIPGIMAEPHQAGSLLCRQDRDWVRK